MSDGLVAASYHGIGERGELESSARSGVRQHLQVKRLQMISDQNNVGSRSGEIASHLANTYPASSHTAGNGNSLANEGAALGHGSHFSGFD